MLLYSWGGSLPENFHGQINYHCELPDQYPALKFSLEIIEDKNLAPSAAIEQFFQDTIQKQYGKDSFSPEQEARLRASMKTEIQLLARLNGQFLGNIHRAGALKSITVAEHYADPGCIPTAFPLQGSLDLTVQVFYTLRPNVNYRLRVETVETVEANKDV